MLLQLSDNAEGAAISNAYLAILIGTTQRYNIAVIAKDNEQNSYCLSRNIYSSLICIQIPNLSCFSIT